MKLKKVAKNKLPNFFKPLFWSYNFSQIDPKKEKKTIIVQAINYGDLDHWKWLAEYYGKKDIQKVIGDIAATEVKPRARRLASIIFDIKEFNYASRGVKTGK